MRRWVQTKSKDGPLCRRKGKLLPVYHFQRIARSMYQRVVRSVVRNQKPDDKRQECGLLPGRSECGGIQLPQHRQVFANRCVGQTLTGVLTVAIVGASVQSVSS